MLVTFGRTNFHFVLCSHFENYSGPGLWWGKNWNQNTSAKRSWLIFRYVLGSVFVAQPSKVSRDRQKTWQRREKKQATWKDNKHQQTKKEMDRATRSKRKTNVTILWWICWSWSPQKLNSLGSMLVSVGFDDHTRRTHGGGEPDQGEHTGRQNVATSPDSAQKRPNGTFSPLPSVKENSLSPFKSRFFFYLLIFPLFPFPQRDGHFRFQVSFRVPGAHGMQKNHQSRFNPSMLGKTFAKCN